MLKHPEPNKSCSVLALVNVDLVLERLTSQQTRVGEWVNVIGYITAIKPSNDRGNGSSDHEIPKVRIQALLLWSAGSLDVQRYEVSVDTLTSKKANTSGGDIPSDALLRRRT